MSEGAQRKSEENMTQADGSLSTTGSTGNDNAAGGSAPSSNGSGRRGYKIQAVARLTGIAAETLRTWERRYRIVDPQRTPGGDRLYSDRDVERLVLVRQLREIGHSVGALSKRPTESLQAMLERHSGALVAARDEVAVQDEGKRRVVRVAVVGSGLAAQMAESTQLEGIKVVASAPGWGALERVARDEDVDVVVADLDALGESPKKAMVELRDYLGAEAVVVVYEFAPSEMLAQLTGVGVRLLKRASGLRELRRAALDAVGGLIPPKRTDGSNADGSPRLPAHDEADTDPLFTEEQLGRLREKRTSLECECPNHLATIVSSLGSFERYAASCAINSPEDAAVHEKLLRQTARARLVMEQSLQLVVEHDGIEV